LSGKFLQVSPASPKFFGTLPMPKLFDLEWPKLVCEHICG